MRRENHRKTRFFSNFPIVWNHPRIHHAGSGGHGHAVAFAIAGTREHGGVGAGGAQKKTRLGYHAKGDIGLVFQFFIDIYRIHILGLDFQLWFSNIKT
jgi:hypothetical protein